MRELLPNSPHPLPSSLSTCSASHTLPSLLSVLSVVECKHKSSNQSEDGSPPPSGWFPKITPADQINRMFFSFTAAFFYYLLHSPLIIIHGTQICLWWDDDHDLSPNESYSMLYAHSHEESPPGQLVSPQLFFFRMIFSRCVVFVVLASNRPG